MCPPRPEAGEPNMEKHKPKDPFGHCFLQLGKPLLREGCYLTALQGLGKGCRARKAGNPQSPQG